MLCVSLAIRTTKTAMDATEDGSHSIWCQADAERGRSSEAGEAKQGTSEDGPSPASMGTLAVDGHERSKPCSTVHVPIQRREGA